MFFSLINFHLKDSGINILTVKKPSERISNHFQIKLGLPKNFGKSFLYVGYPGNLSYLTNSFTSSLIKTVDINSKKQNVKIYKFAKND